MAPFQWIMSWHEVLPIHHMAALLDVGFFPKWHQVSLPACFVLVGDAVLHITDIRYQPSWTWDFSQSGTFINLGSIVVFLRLLHFTV
jgi:membrane protein YdbS with pleckstrin-like domain